MASLGFAIFAAVLLILMLVVISMGFIIVPQGYEYAVERLGKYTKTLKAGPNLIIPFLDNIREKVDMRERTLDIPPQDVLTNDNVTVKVDGIVYYQIMDTARAIYRVTNLEEAIGNLIQANIRGVIGTFELQDLLSAREKLGEDLSHDLDDAIDPWGVKVLRVKIQDISPPADLVEAMTRQMRAEREKRAVILEAEGRRESEIKRAEGERDAAIKKADGEKNAIIQRAEGEKESTVLRAEGQLKAAQLEAEWKKDAAFREAESRERLAEAEAKAVMMLSQAVAKGNVQALNYMMADKYIQALHGLAAANNQKVIMMPLEASNVIGALAGISEIAKESFQSSPRNDAAPARKPSDLTIGMET